jgi:hypothetical protein
MVKISRYIVRSERYGYVYRCYASLDPGLLQPACEMRPREATRDMHAQDVAELRVKKTFVRELNYLISKAPVVVINVLLQAFDTANVALVPRIRLGLDRVCP